MNAHAFKLCDIQWSKTYHDREQLVDEEVATPQRKSVYLHTGKHS